MSHDQNRILQPQFQEKLTVADFFSGVGGFSLGLERSGGFRTICFCEIDPFCRKVLAKHWPDVPCHHDITKLRGSDVGPVDVVCGGFPCTDISVAGKRTGADGQQSRLWRDLVRLSWQARWSIVENVGHTWRQWVPVLRLQMRNIGRATLPLSVRASGFGAVHNRHRIILVAHPDSERLRELKRWWCGPGGQVAQELAGARDWAPRRLGTADGVRDRLDRCRALGNSILPQIPELIGRAILQVEGRP